MGSSYKVLNNDSGTVAVLCFFTYIPLVHRSARSFQIRAWLQFLKGYKVKVLKSSLYASHKSSSRKLSLSYSRALNFTKLLIPLILMPLDYILIPLAHFSCPLLIYVLMSAILVII
jgi:hypothetical protein